MSSAPICPYCGAVSKLVPDSDVYGRSFGKMMYSCRPCDAYVGVHKNSPDNKPLGRLANKPLRQLKVQAHYLFDPLWQAAIENRGWSKGRARRAAYAWLAEQMSMSVALCHIGMFDEQQTCRVIELCTAVHENRKDREV